MNFFSSSYFVPESHQICVSIFFLINFLFKTRQEHAKPISVDSVMSSASHFAEVRVLPFFLLEMHMLGSFETEGDYTD